MEDLRLRKLLFLLALLALVVLFFLCIRNGAPRIQASIHDGVGKALTAAGAAEVPFAVDGRDVTLGTAGYALASTDRISELERRVRSVPGVRTVRNLLTQGSGAPDFRDRFGR